MRSRCTVIGATNLKKFFFAVVTASVGLAASFAQAANLVAVSKIEAGSWTMNAVYSDTTTPPAVDDIVAIAAANSVFGDNIVAVWYHKSGGVWSTASWATTNPWPAINYIKSQLGISSSEDGNWSTQGFPVLEYVGETPTAYTGGLLESDPLVEYVAASPDPATVVQNLTTIGYASAVNPIDAGPECPIDAKLGGLADLLAAMIAGGDRAVLTPGSSIDCTWGGIPKGDLPPMGTPPATAPAWSPPGTDPSLPPPPGTPAWIPGPWPTVLGGLAPDYDCKLVLNVGAPPDCVCKRIRYWGRWETCLTGSCIEEHFIQETEKCTAPGSTSCPPHGPAGPNCQPTYIDY